MSLATSSVIKPVLDIISLSEYNIVEIYTIRSNSLLNTLQAQISFCYVTFGVASPQHSILTYFYSNNKGLDASRT